MILFPDLPEAELFAKGGFGRTLKHFLIESFYTKRPNLRFNKLIVRVHFNIWISYAPFILCVYSASQ